MPADRDAGRVARLLSALTGEPGQLVKPLGGDRYAVSEVAGGKPWAVPAGLLRRLVSAGLLETGGDGAIRATTAAGAWLARHRAASRPHHSQHAEIVCLADSDARATGPAVEVNADESPIGRLARRSGRDGRPVLSPAAVKAAERLRADFERGHLQPRLTADWTAPTRPRRRSGGAGGIAELTDSAIAARGRFNAAIRAIGPEFAGVVTDVSCFLKGLETVERERGWPARSAKLVLGLGLAALARHYGLQDEATGRPVGKKIRHWGAEGYRPKIDG